MLASCAETIMHQLARRSGLIGALLLTIGCPGAKKVALPKDSSPATPRDIYSPTPTPEARVKDSAKPNPEGPKGDQKIQGTTCTGSGVEFTVDQVLAPSKSVSVTVKANATYVWVLVGIKPPDTDTNWFGGVTNASCNGGTCSWTFPKVLVPSSNGPYTLYFMRDAVNDNPGVGQIVGSCAP
jgi:hypothetical protein